MANPSSSKPKGNPAGFRSLVRELSVAMLTSVDPSGQLHSRPMISHPVSGDGDLWFLTQTGAPKIGELIHDRRVNVSFLDPSRDLYVSVSGTAELVRDRAKVREIWNEADQKWFPKGPEDAELGLIRVHVERVEAWGAELGKSAA